LLPEKIRDLNYRPLLSPFIPGAAPAELNENWKNGSISSISKSARSPYRLTANDRADGLKCPAPMLNGIARRGSAIAIFSRRRRNVR
jgi:hypothetical protein